MSYDYAKIKAEMEFYDGSLAYKLFLYRQELKRVTSSESRKTKAKFRVTYELMDQTDYRLNTVTMQQLKDFKQAAIYKKELQQKMELEEVQWK